MAGTHWIWWASTGVASRVVPSVVSTKVGPRVVSTKVGPSVVHSHTSAALQKRESAAADSAAADSAAAAVSRVVAWRSAECCQRHVVETFAAELLRRWGRCLEARVAEVARVRPLALPLVLKPALKPLPPGARRRARHRLGSGPAVRPAVLSGSGVYDECARSVGGRRGRMRRLGTRTCDAQPAPPSPQPIERSHPPSAWLSPQGARAPL